MKPFTALRCGLLTSGLALAAASAQALCEQPLRTPVAAIANTVRQEGEQVLGFLPELLHSVSATQGCRFQFSLVPRARLELLYELGQVPVMLAAVRTERRDGFGDFVPLLDTRAALISLQHDPALVPNLRALPAPRRVVVVRGFDFGASYRDWVQALRRQGRLRVEADISGALRALQAGLADYTVLFPAHAHALTQREPRFAELGSQLRTGFLHELPWHTAGVYLSHRALPKPERDWLRQRLQEATETGQVWRQLSQHYSAEAMAGSMRPL